MDVLIKGMEMPSCCMFCPISNSSGCGMMNPPVLMTTKEMLADRPDWCPLLPLPNEHGALVDFESLDVSLYLPDVGYLSDYQQGWNDAMHRIINSGKIIIPAEEGE